MCELSGRQLIQFQALIDPNSGKAEPQGKETRGNASPAQKFTKKSIRNLCLEMHN